MEDLLSLPKQIDKISSCAYSNSRKYIPGGTYDF